MGQVLRSVPAGKERGQRVAALQGEAQAPGGEGVRAENGRWESPKKGDGKQGLSLRSHHQKLADEGYVPPAPPEVPFVYVGKLKGKRKLSDEEVGEARALCAELTYQQLAEKYGVHRGTIENAIKGVTYRHLNGRFLPRW